MNSRKDVVSSAKPPTIHTVAQRVGVSPSLVSLALNGKPGVSERRRTEIIEIARQLGYSPSPVARALRKGESSVYGLIARNFDNPFFADVMIGMQDLAAQTGHVIVSLDSGYDRDRELLYMRNLAARRIEGLAIAPIGHADTLTEWRRLMPNAPTVLINADGSPHPDAMHVTPDSWQAVKLALGHLHELGHRHIAFLTAPEGQMADDARLDAYLHLCRKYYLEPYVFPSSLAFESLVSATRKMLNSGTPPTALIVNSDYAAQAVYAASRSLGVDIGRNLSVVGHDDLASSALLDPPLTTISLDRRNIGRETLLRLTGSANGDHRQQVSLVVRRSTAAI